MYLLVLGIPFSGASQIARLLQSMGLRFISGTPGIDDDADMTSCLQSTEPGRLHKHILDALALDWNRLHGFDDSLVPDETIQIFQAEARSLLGQEKENTPCALYDPVLCLMTPLWRRLMHRVVSLYVYRHPIDIALALHDCYGYPIPFGLALWEQYTIQSVRDTRRKQCVMVSYEELMQNPFGQTRRLYKQLAKSGIPDLRKPSPKAIQKIIEQMQGSTDKPDRLLKEWANPRQVHLCRRFRKGKLFGEARLPELSLGAQEQMQAFAQDWSRRDRKLAGDTRTGADLHEQLELVRNELHWTNRWIEKLNHKWEALSQNPALSGGADADVKKRIAKIEAAFTSWHGIRPEPGQSIPETTGWGAASDGKSRGNELLEMGRFDEAEHVFKLLKGKKPDKPWGFVGYARVAFERGHNEAALERWDAVLERFPVHAQSLSGKGNTLIRVGRFDEAEQVFERLKETHPENIQGYAGYARTAFQFGDEAVALERWDALLERFPDQENGLSGKGNMLLNLGRFDEAEQIFEKLKEKYPNNPQGYIGYARTAFQRRDWTAAIDRWEEVTRKFPEDFEAGKSKIRALMSYSDFDAATQYMDILKSRFPDKKNQLLSIILHIHKRRLNRDDMKRVLDEILTVQSPDVDYKTIISGLYHDFYIDESGQVLEHALTIFQTSYPDPKVVLDLNMTKCALLILKKEYVKALELIDRLREDLADYPRLMQSKNWADIQLWKYAQTGRIEQAKAFWVEYEKYFTEVVTSDSIDDFRLLSSASVTLLPDDIILIAKIRNEIHRIPSFYEYYKQIGIDKFLFIDNGSDDGTVEFLLPKSDVYLFQTNDGMSRSYAGAKWFNHLIDRYAVRYNNWCVVVDGDEFLVTPKIEERGLRPLLTYMDYKGYEGLFAFMIDMYPANLSEMQDNDSASSFRDVFRYFDNNYRFWGYLKSPYTFVTGGFRRRFANNPYLLKTPIVKATDSIKYLDANHFTTPINLCDVSGILLHYKFVGDIQSDITTEILRKEYAQGAYQYHQYKKYFFDLPDGFSFLMDDSVAYSSSDQLIELGLMKHAPDYKKFIAELQENNQN